MSERLSDERLAELESLAAEATPPPWRVAHEDAMSPTDVPVLTEGDYLCASPDDGVRGGHLRADAMFIAAARTAIPALLAEVREHRARVAADERDRAALGTTPESVTDAGGPSPLNGKWVCGKCARAVVHGYDDGQIEEHHRTCPKRGRVTLTHRGT